MDLVATLKAQHRMLGEIVERLGGHLAHGDAARVRVTLEELRRALGAHVDLEEARFYPPLWDSPLADPEELAAARGFSSLMRPLKQSLDALAERHAAGDFDVEAFRSDWSEVAGALHTRLATEEETLFPLFQRVVGKNGLLRRAVEVRAVTRGAA